MCVCVCVCDCCSVAQSCLTLCDPLDCSIPGFLSFTLSQSLLTFMSIESVMPSNHLILCCPLLLLPSVFPSIRVFPSELALRIRWPKYWSFSFSISPSNGYSGLISFRMDWLDLLAVQGTLKSLLQYHSSKASVHQCSAFFMVQLSHPYMTVYNWMLFCHEKGNILPFALGLEHIVLVGWIRQRETSTVWCHLYEKSKKI